jgi:hypothetical protein
LPAEQAASLRAGLDELDVRVRRCAQKIDAGSFDGSASSTPSYGRDEARADYHALLACIDRLEAVSAPLASIAFDDTALSSGGHEGTAASPPAAQAARFAEDLTRMSNSLRGEVQQLQHYLSSVAQHTRASSEQVRKGKEAMMLGAIQAAANEQAMQLQQQQQQQQQQLHFQQQQQHQQQQQQQMHMAAMQGHHHSPHHLHQQQQQHRSVR